MCITIYFHKSIQKFTNVASATLEANSYFDLIKNCLNLFPDLEKAFKHSFLQKNKKDEFCLMVGGKPLENEHLLFLPSKTKKIVLCPLVVGCGRTFATIAIIAIAIVVAVVAWQAALAASNLTVAGTASAVAAEASAGLIAGQAGMAMSIAKFAIGLAINQTLGLIMGAMMKPPKAATRSEAPDAGARRGNDAFGDLDFTTSQQAPVALNYGLVRVSGQYASGYIKYINHGKNDVIKVSNYI